MTPERLQQIRQIYERAMRLTPARRAAYLAGACGDDAELRREVDSLVETGKPPAATDEPTRTDAHVPAAAANSAPAEPSSAPAEPSAPRRSRRSSGRAPLEVVPGRTTLGAYRILEKIGAGGMGTVYLAKDARLGRRVALKLLPAHFARDTELVRRFEQEARAASALNHPNILTVHEIGEARGRLFIVTEFVEGKTLRERMWEGRFDVAEALDVCAQVAGALQKAHAAGVIHRDVKPENVMLDEDGHVKVLDFGIAKQIAPVPAVDTEAPTNAQVNTASGVVLGTTAYMSPEQVRGLDLDGRSDVWSLGCVLYELLTGHAPFEEKNFGDLVVAILHGDPPALTEVAPEVAADVGLLVARALAKRREDRYESAKVFREELKRVARLLDLRAGTSHAAPAMPTTAAPPAAAKPRTESPRHSASAPTVAGRKHQTTEQRRQLTVLFADLAEGLAALTEGLDAEDVGELMSTLWPVVDSVVEAHGGEVTKRVGEAFVVLWGARGAREDDPERAVRAALEMQSALFAFVAGERAQDPNREEAEARLMRAGVSTGLVLLGEVETTGELTVTGDPVRLASRLQQEAEVGCVLISHDTYRHVRGVFDVLPPESVQTGGRPEPVQCYRVLRAKRRAFRVETRGVEGVETKMVGRRAELRRLTDTLESVFEEGELQVVTVLADAGLGKSRLLYEFSNWVELLPDLWYVFNARAGESDQGLPYSLVRDLFSFRFEIQDSDPAAVAREKLERGMLSMCKGTAEAEVLMRAHFIGQLIGFDYSASPYVSGIRDDARQVRDRAFRYAARFFSDVARSLPTLLYFDDIHWADDGSLDFIDHLALHCANDPVMLFCLARPALLERRPAWGEGRERHTRLTLQPLSKKESRQLVEEILRRAHGIPAELRELVVGGAEGNPFYVEELIKMLIDQKVIVPGAEVWSVDATRLGEVQVPPTLTGVLQARLDRLTPEEKTVLQRASVIGRVFWDDAAEHLGAGVNAPAGRATMREPFARAVPADEVEVARVLEALRGKELVYRREAAAFAGTREYIFKHALLRDVTYESVLKRERREYHRHAAGWLARRSGGRVGEYAGLIAEHFERAQVTEDAAEWYGRAGRQARESYAPETAIRYYRKALGFLATRGVGPEPGDELALNALRMEWYEGLGEVLRVQARYSESVEAYQEMRAAAEALQATPAQARAWNEIALVQSSQGDNRACFESTQRAELLARAAGNSSPAAGVELARTLNLQSQVCTRLGDAQAAMRLADRALSLVDGLGDEGRRVRAECLKSLGMAYHMLGQFKPAEEFKSLSLGIYRELGDRRYVGNLLNSLGETARLRGDYAASFARYSEALQIAREIGNRNGEILYLANLGAARVGLGKYEEAESDLRQTIELATVAGYVGLSENYRFLAEALLGRGRLAEAREAAGRAFELGREIENQEHLAEAWRVLGLVASNAQSTVEVGDETCDAAACFAQSLSIFARIQMEAERARTLRDWARHELASGDPERGRQLLKEARDFFQRLDMELELERT